MDLISIILSIVSLITAGLSLFIIRGKQHDSNKIFALFILSISLWSFGLLLFRLTRSLDLALHISRFYYIVAAAIPTFFLHFSILFPEKKKQNSILKACLYAPLFIITIGLIINPNLILTDVYFLNDGVKSATLNLVNYLIYSFYFCILLVIAYVNLFRSYFNSKNHIIKAQLRFIFIGTIIPYVIAMYFDLILPLFNYTYIWIGPLMAIVVVWALLYAVYRHHLLNTKVITTELFTASLWIFILIKTLISNTDQDRFTNVGLLVLTIVVGVLLIKSVRKEVSQRERIEILAADLQKANERLTELDRQKSEFVSFATHQLRAPLTAMKGYSSLILEGDMGALPKQAREAVSRIFESTNTLTSIVDDYLNITRIELGSMKYAFETIDLKQLVEDVIGEIKPNIDKTKLAFSLEIENSGTDYRITADRDKLKQVIANLIDNSLKYTPSGSVKVSLAYDRRNHKFIFAVKDTGVGIAPETMPRLFQKFSRAENANKTNMRGTGLGLYVAKEIITAHHASIRAESAGEGKGSTFIVEIEPFWKA